MSVIKGGEGARTLVVYPRGDPAYSWLFRSLSEIHPIVAVSGERGLDLLRLCIGTSRPDPQRPLPLPFAPWGAPWRERPHGSILRRLAPQAECVILTRPDQLPLAKAFGGVRKIYHVVDDYASYARPWLDQERAVLALADHIVAVSQDLACKLRARHPFEDSRLTILPNAVASDVIPAACPRAPSALPEGIDLPRPVAGVIGRISSRLRLDWIKRAADRLTWLHWLFVGDTEASEMADGDWPVLKDLHDHPRCRFIGARPYDQLSRFAAAVDVAILPYSSRSINPSASPMRFFLQLPFGAPILATPGCAQLEEFAPLLTTCVDPDALERNLDDLRARGFDDGLRQERWRASQRHTWDARARTLLGLIEA